VPMGVDCARAGVPMLVEKPIADTVELACELLREAKRANVRILVGYHRRYHAQAQEARRIVGGGRLGRLVAVTALWATRKPDPYFDTAWRRTAGGGPILINLIHEIDMLRYVGGELASVAGVTSHAMRGFEVEDTAAATFAYAGGALGTVLCTDAAVSPWTIEQGLGENPVFPYTGENGFRFLGTAGALEFPQLKVWSSRDPAKVGWDPNGEMPRLTPEFRDVYAEQIRHLRAVVEGREAPVVSGADGARTLAATLAVHESARTDDVAAERYYHAAIDAAEAVRGATGARELRPWVLARRAGPYVELLGFLAERGRGLDALQVAESLHARTWLDAALGRPATAAGSLQAARARAYQDAWPSLDADALRAVFTSWIFGLVVIRALGVQQPEASATADVVRRMTVGLSPT